MMRRRKPGGRESGQGIVEFALILPVLLVLLLGIMQFGILFNAYLTLEEAARVGVRAWATGQAITQTDIQSTVDQAMPTLAPGDFGTVVLTCPQYGSGCPNSDPGNLTQSQGTMLEVTVPYTASIAIPPFDAILGASITMHSSVVMEAESS